MDPGGSGPTDSELVLRAQQGDRTAFGELYRRHVTPIYRYLRSRVGDVQDAEDLTETTFLKAFQALPRYRERGWPFSAFLYQVARNAMADRFRSRRAEQDVEAERAAPDVGSDPAEQVERSEMIAAMAAALATLPENYQEVIRLRVLLDLPTATAAHWMRRSEGSTRVLLFRALQMLRKKMRPRDG